MRKSFLPRNNNGRHLSVVCAALDLPGRVNSCCHCFGTCSLPANSWSGKSRRTTIGSSRSKFGAVAQLLRRALEGPNSVGVACL